MTPLLPRIHTWPYSLSMDECPLCSKAIPEGQKIQVTAKGACSVCGLDLNADTRSIEYEQTDQEKARLAEIRRLQRIAYGPTLQSAQLTKTKGLLALTILICIFVYLYIDKQNKETAPRNRIEVTYRAFNLMFGPGSGLADDEKLEEFKYWRMSPVRWKGTVNYINLGPEDDLYVTLNHVSRLPSSNVLVHFSERWRDQLADLKVGHFLRYTGRISEFDRGTSFITLKQGKIIGDPR